jgi:hypothetical protein
MELSFERKIVKKAYCVIRDKCDQKKKKIDIYGLAYVPMDSRI